MVLKTRLWRLSVLLAVQLVAGVGAIRADETSVNGRWVGTWATSNLPEPTKSDTPALAGATLRQVVHVSLGGERIRVRLANTFGGGPLELQGAHVAIARAEGTTEPGTDRELRFSGSASVAVPAGAYVWSDPVELKIAPLGDLAISLLIKSAPATLTGHPGSRTHSYLQPGDALAATSLSGAAKFVHWYFISGVDVFSGQPGAVAIVTLGDSITDGYGCKPDTNTRWPDELARRLAERTETMEVGVLNHGIGGNRLLRDGLGPNILARFDRDVVVQSGARWVIVLAGINDIGTRVDARTKNASFASAAELIAAYEQLLVRAKTHGLKVVGATITPFEGSKNYWSEDGESDRQKINEWIRKSGRFDAVLDFDAVLRDPSHPTRLDPAYDCGDHLHPSIEGYKKMATVVDLDLFVTPRR